MPDKVAASVHVYRGADMTKRGRRSIAAWIRRQATFLEHHGQELAPSYRARYLYPDRTRKPKKK